jgi:hypothetical protein
VEWRLALTCGCRWRDLMVSRHGDAVYDVSQFGYATMVVMPR